VSGYAALRVYSFLHCRLSDCPAKVAPGQAEDIAILAAMTLRLFLLCILALLTSTAHAWGTQGNQVIASLAQAQLTANAKTEIDKLHALEPGKTLATAA